MTRTKRRRAAKVRLHAGRGFKKFMGNPSIKAAINAVRELDREPDAAPGLIKETLEQEKQRGGGRPDLQGSRPQQVCRRLPSQQQRRYIYASAGRRLPHKPAPILSTPAA